MGICFFISLLGYTLLMKRLLLNIKIGSAFYSAYLGMFLCSYIFVIIFNVYQPAAYIILYVGIVSLIAIFVLSFIKKDKFLLKQDIKMIIGIIGLLGLFIYLLGDGVFKSHDAYSFWGRAAKELYTFDKFYINPESNMSHTDYNPIMASLQYCITKTFGWKEKYLFYPIIACVTACFTMLCDFIKTFWGKVLFILMSLCCITFLGSTFSTAFLGADLCLGLIFGTSAIRFVYREDDNITEMLPILLSILILPAIKLYTGLLFSVILIALIILDKIEPFYKKKQYLLIGLVCILFMQFSWSVVYNYHIQKKNYAIENNIKEYMGEEYEDNFHLSIKNLVKGNPRNDSFLNSIDNNDITDNVNSLMNQTLNVFNTHELYGVHLTVIQTFLVFILGILYLRWTDKGQKERISKCIKIFGISIVLYVGGMFVTYFVEPGTAAEPIRYIGIVAIPIIVLFYFSLFFNFKNKRNKNILFLTILIMILNIRYGGVITKAYKADDSQGYIYAQYTDKQIKNYIDEVVMQFGIDERILLIDAYDDNFQNYIEGKNITGISFSYQYMLLPRRINVLVEDCQNINSLQMYTMNEFDEIIKNERIHKILLLSNDYNRIEFYKSLFGFDEIYHNILTIVDVHVIDGEIKYTNITPNTKKTKMKEISQLVLKASNDDYFFEVLCDGIELEKEYGVEIEVIEKEVGEAEKVEVIVYDFTRELVIEKHEFEISNKRQEWFFEIKNDEIENDNLQLLIYAGTRGSTEGNSIIIKNINLYHSP